MRSVSPQSPERHGIPDHVGNARVPGLLGARPPPARRTGYVAVSSPCSSHRPTQQDRRPPTFRAATWPLGRPGRSDQASTDASGRQPRGRQDGDRRDHRRSTTERKFLAGDGGHAGATPASRNDPHEQLAELPPRPRYDRSKAEEIRLYVGDEKAIGRLYRGDDVEPAGDLIYSGQRGPGSGGPGLTGGWKLWDSLTQHAEGHAAAIMRRDSIRDGVLYLNMHPCRKPKGCHDNIEEALPQGSRLTVWVVNKDGSSLRRIYEGNGEATEP